MVRRAAGPVRVAVHGRRGAGRGTVAAALTGAGVVVVAGPAAEVDVLVIAEAPKPEDRAVLASIAGPVLVVLNKADLIGSAERRAAECEASIGVRPVPLVGLLAAVRLDDELVAALRLLVTDPADLTSTDAFVRSQHRVPRALRERLLAVLDRFGVAQSVHALRTGVAAADLPALLGQVSGVDEVLGRLDGLAAPVRYRRVLSAVAELRVLAARPGGGPVSRFLAADDTVVAVMAAAVEVVEAAGMVVDRSDDPAAHLRRARRWRHYGRGPVDALHRCCGADISRGSLRLLAQAQQRSDAAR